MLLVEGDSETADWRKSSAEEVLKHAKLWVPSEDAWLKSRKIPSASERAQQRMESHMVQSQLVDSPDVDGIADGSDDPKVLCAWLARSMPCLPWPNMNDNWEDDLFVWTAKSKRPPNAPPFRWTPPSNTGCRHPDDHIIVAPPSMPTQENGRCYLRSTPTFFRPRVGNSKAPKTRALLDNCANLCLASRAFMERASPDAHI